MRLSATLLASLLLASALPAAADSGVSNDRVVAGGSVRQSEPVDGDMIGLGGNEAPREGAFCDVTVRAGDTLVVEDASTDEVFADNPFVVGDPHLRFYAGHPLAAPGGEHFGTLCILDTRPRTLDARQRELLRELAGWVQAEITQVHELDDASLGYSEVEWVPAENQPKWDALLRRVWRVRGYGDFYSHVLVAEGAVDVACEPELNLYDVAGVSVIVTEAGGRFTGVDGVDGPGRGSGVSSNGLLHDAVIAALS